MRGLSIRELVLGAIRSLYTASLRHGLELAVDLLEKLSRGEIASPVEAIDSRVLEEDSKLRELFEKLDSVADSLWGVGWNDCLDLFIDTLHLFYGEVVDRERGLRNFESCLFTVLCMFCGKPMVFTYRGSDWLSVVKPTVLQGVITDLWCCGVT